MLSKGFKHSRKERGSIQRGAALVEAVISIMVFMVIIISIIELLRFSFYSVTLNHIVNDTLRQARVAHFQDPANCQLGPNGQFQDGFLNAEPESRVICIKDQLIATAAKFGITLDPFNDTIVVRTMSRDLSDAATVGPGKCDPNPALGVESAGERRDFVSICVRKDVPFVQALNVTLEFLVIGKNEDFA